MEGSNTSISDDNGNPLFYSNSCKIVNAKGEIMQNGDGINPGQIGDVYCPSGGSPILQGVIALPHPANDSLYFVFNLDYDQPYVLDTNFYGSAPQRLYCQTIDMAQDGGGGAVVQKNQIAVQDTFARGNIQAARHANGKDWWVIVPKSHSNCYFLVPVTSDGVQPAQLKCAGHVWSDNDSGAQAVFSPDLKKYIQFNGWNGLNIFDFDNATGELSNPVRIQFPNDTIGYIAGVAVSPNSRHVYVCARKRVYQFDLQAVDIESSKVQVAEWDGFHNPYLTIFYLAALAPDGKIYISSTSSTLNLHVIHKPDCPGLKCELEQHGITLPAYNFATIPNFPHYRNQPSGIDCDSMVIATAEASQRPGVVVFPNPANGFVNFQWENLSNHADNRLLISDFMGKTIRQIEGLPVSGERRISVEGLPAGVYAYRLLVGQKVGLVGKFVVIR